MAKDDPLVLRLYRDQLLMDLARRVNYLGFPAAELAEKCKSLAEGYGAKRLSVALQEICTFEANRVMLNRTTRPLVWQLLGPVPEVRKEFYKNATHRPADWDQEVEIPKGEPDPIMEGCYRLTPSQLETMLREAWAKRKSPKDYVSELAKEQIPRIESELLRRGEKIPTEPPEEVEKAEEPPKKRRAKKAS